MPQVNATTRSRVGLGAGPCLKHLYPLLISHGVNTHSTTDFKLSGCVTEPGLVKRCSQSTLQEVRAGSNTPLEPVQRLNKVGWPRVGTRLVQATSLPHTVCLKFILFSIRKHFLMKLLAFLPSESMQIRPHQMPKAKKVAVFPIAKCQFVLKSALNHLSIFACSCFFLSHRDEIEIVF